MGAQVWGSGGKISVDGSSLTATQQTKNVECGTPVELTARADFGYCVDEWRFDYRVPGCAQTDTIVYTMPLERAGTAHVKAASFKVNPSPPAYAPPLITGGDRTITIPEETTAGAAVGEPLAATVDPRDDDGRATWSLSGSTDFAIDAATGQISVASGVALDYDTQSSYALTATAADSTANTPNSASVTVTVKIQQPAGPLALSLSAPNICDVRAPLGWFNDDGSWYTVDEVRVSWRVSGGRAPYTLVIDGETRDGDGDYTGASGTASVSCALSKGKVSFGVGSHSSWAKTRTYSTEPTVDSGLKTITATVTDAKGANASAAIDVYMVMNTVGIGDTLRAGHTYRLYGILVTIPPGLDMVFDHHEHSECVGPGRCTDSITIIAREGRYSGDFTIGLDSGTEYGERDYWLRDGTKMAADDPGNRLSARFDQIAERLGEEPDPSAMSAD